MKVLAGVLVSLVAFVVLLHVYFMFGFWMSSVVEDLSPWWWQLVIWAVLAGLALLDAYVGIWTYRCLDRRCHH